MVCAWRVRPAIGGERPPSKLQCRVLRLNNCEWESAGESVDVPAGGATRRKSPVTGDPGVRPDWCTWRLPVCRGVARSECRNRDDATD